VKGYQHSLTETGRFYASIDSFETKMLYITTEFEPTVKDEVKNYQGKTEEKIEFRNDDEEGRRSILALLQHA
jgi:hypothetical protein